MNDLFAEGPHGGSSSLPGDGGEVLLALAVAKGLVDPGLVARLQDETAKGESETVLWSRHGPVVDTLLAKGLLQAGQVLALQAELAGGDEVQTRADPHAEGHTFAEAPSFAEARRVEATARAFPVPGWDRYEDIEYLAQGGMARVYKARDPRLKRDVAIKVLFPREGPAAPARPGAGCRPGRHRHPADGGGALEQRGQLLPVQGGVPPEARPGSHRGPDPGLGKVRTSLPAGPHLRLPLEQPRHHPQGAAV